MSLWSGLFERPRVRPALPLDEAVLETLRLTAGRHAPSTARGMHLRRCMGQSLEFREHRRFVPGDDIRFVDWRASARTGGATDRLVRVFDAEERLDLGIVVDCAPAMDLPRARPKADVARWTAAALARIAAAGGDRVLLRGPWPDGPARRGLAAVEAVDAVEAGGDLGTLLADAAGALPHAALLVVVSDFYAEPDPGRLTGLRRLQRQHGAVLAIELDSWPAERAALLAGPSRIAGRDGAVEPGDGDLEASERAIRARIAEWQGLLDHGGLTWTRWSWPETDGDLADWFAERFLGDPAIAALFARSP